MNTSIAKQAVFVGDSLIQWFTKDGHPYWTKYFTSNYNCVNLGVPGITTEETINRLTKGNLLQHKALAPNVTKVCPLLIGTNDLGWGHEPEYIARQIKAIIDILQSQFVNSKVLLFGILPRGAAVIRCTDKPYLINQLICKYDNGSSVRYLDMTDKFCKVDESGNVRLNKNLYWPDLLHLSAEGYKVWAETMLELFSEMMADSQH